MDVHPNGVLVSGLGIENLGCAQEALRRGLGYAVLLSELSKLFKQVPLAVRLATEDVELEVLEDCFMVDEGHTWPQTPPMVLT